MATNEQIKALRDATGAGVLDCKKALDQFNGDFDKALAWLNEKGLAAAAKKSARETREGIVEAYAHPGGRLAVLVEVNCETDFVARTPEFKELAHDLALQIASMSPQYIRREDVPAELVASKLETHKREALAEGKKPEIAERIATGKLEKFYQETCLMEQAFVKDDKLKVRDLITAAIAKIGENIVVRRFARYELGEEL
ncbi:MAG: translation elongation factor Ts [Anaerolineae bacterium]|nr:translation elongation factor Ts [Thermoflexales bacterium]MDW8408201.1 translation elongation factor Ts [Anaerolineae bacterium]